MLIMPAIWRSMMRRWERSDERIDRTKRQLAPGAVSTAPRHLKHVRSGRVQQTLAWSLPGVGDVKVALPEVERNLIKRALLPLFRLRQPEHLTLGIQQR